MRRTRFAALLCLLSCAAPARAADTGLELVAALAGCDGRFFRALKEDAARWRGESAFLVRGNVATFFVTNRQPPGPWATQAAEARFALPADVEGLRLVSWFDSDLSRWDHFRTRRLQFLSWGFYVQQSSEQTMLWLARHLPDTALRLAALRPGTPRGSYCRVQALFDGAWRDSNEPCDAGLPVDPQPRRVFAVRAAPVEHAASVLSCEIWGALPPEVLTPLRPDLGTP